MKKITEIAIAIILFFAFGASMSVATTNIDPVHHYAKVVLDGSYIDFGCPITFQTVVGAERLPFVTTSTYSDFSNASRVTDPVSLTGGDPLSTQPTSSTVPTFSQFTISSRTTAPDPFQQNLTIISGLPGVESVSVSTATITDALAGGRFSIIVTFTQPMDQNNSPTVILSPDLVTSGTLIFSDVSWAPDGRTYTVEYQVADRDETYASVSAQIVGGITQGVPGLPAEQYTAENLFAVSMAPSSSSSSLSQSANCDVVVSDYLLTGSAHDQDGGPILMDPVGGGVFNDAFGNLSGYAWGQSTGWINFAPTGGGVTIDADGFFHGLAWSQNLGWIAFECDILGICANDPFRVRTSWRPGETSSVVVATTPPSSSSSSGPSTSPSAGGGSPAPSPSPTTPSTPTTPVTPVTPTTTPTPTESPSTSPEIPVLPTSAPSPVPSTGNPPAPSPTALPETRPNEAAGPSVLDEIVGVLFRGFENLAAFIHTVKGDITFKTIAAAGALGAMLSTPGSVWRSALSVLAFRKRKPWGTVYDSVTKQPLDPAYVVLKDAEGREVNTSITDLDGRYGFLADAGRFTIVANKTNYVFPSSRLGGRGNDELYSDLYFGGPIDILKKGDVITKNIPLDPVNPDWNETAKREQKLMKFYSKRDLIIARVTSILFWFGFALSGFALAVAPGPLNVGIVALYALVFILKETLLKGKKRGMLTDTYGNPLSFAILRIFSANLNTEIIHKATNALGQYYALVPNGTYYAKIEVKNPDGSYTLAHTSEPFEVKKGVIDRNFAI